ncbi:hypothetical protein [Paenibacillus lutrae]|uniref:Uncharacterized protein n=1 Tax=Paenibacillus lutrae TaxID=2078573 RepID=A0A7X3JXW6_9BACL|nr:hypothetical protein [Paenibacillus lutrae]MVO98446.1 hypothetical protein [Paenibacillus lutrae]
MNKIRHAKVLKVTKDAGIKVADVEFALEGFQQPLMARLKQSSSSLQAAAAAGRGEEDLVIGDIYRSEGDHSFDWYNNNEPSAYKEISAELFAAAGTGTEDQREQLKRQLLEYGDVKHELQSGFEGAPSDVAGESGDSSLLI